MRTTVKMPKVGDSVDEVTIIEWERSVGDPVGEGEGLVQVETDKAVVSVPSPVAGVVAELLVDVDDDVRTGTPIAVITAN